MFILQHLPPPVNIQVVYISQLFLGKTQKSPGERRSKKARRAGGLWERISPQHFEGRIFHP